MKIFPALGLSGKKPGELASLSLMALGVVYGDIGTSPLYAVRACFFGTYGVAPTEENVLGVLSLIFWSLMIVISIKYLIFVLRADNGGEGGILALMELVRRRTQGRTQKAVFAAGLFGAALLYGDGMITPAISVLSAIEGIEVATPLSHSVVIPITVAVLVFLFLLQRLGTGGVGRLFGPIVLVWFVTLAATGAAAIARQPLVLQAVNPWYGVAFFLHNGTAAFTILGFVFLVVTGGEALYADIGHFGAAPIRLGWYSLVLPSLLMNYFGQGALILDRPGGITNPFYQLVPHWGLYPLVALATCATVIASQAIIAGAFSLTFQAFQLGYLPRLSIRHTSSEQRGQIYIPLVNWTLLLSTIVLVLGFQRSGNLASAYGVAITATMLITTLLFAVAMRRIFSWPIWTALGLTLVFLAVDLAFFTANMGKFLDGGWVPLLVAGMVFLLTTTWQKGFALERRKSRNRIMPVRAFLREIGGGAYRRVPGQAVYLTGVARGTPHSLRHNLRHNRALHSMVIVYTATVLKAPRVRAVEHLRVRKLRPDIIRVIARYGYMQTIDVPGDLAAVDRAEHLGLDLDKLTYFVGGDIMIAERDIGLSMWRSWLYALMARNELPATRYFNLPARQVFEIGTHIEV